MESQTSHIPGSIARLLDGEGKVNQSVTCIGCEYDLRTMHHGASCPECGRRVWDSLRLVRLSDFDPAWIGAIAKRFRLIAVAIALPFVLPLIGYVAPEGRRSEQFGIVIVASTMVTPMVLLFYGSWLLGRYTSDEPRGITRKFARAGSRWLLAIFVAGLFLGMSSDTLLRRVVPAISSFLPLIVLACAGAGAVAVLLRASFLARLVPSSAIAIQGLALGACLAVVSFISVVAVILLTAPHEEWINLLPAAASDVVIRCSSFYSDNLRPYGWIVWSVTLPVLLLWTAALLWWCSRRFYEARRAALRRVGHVMSNPPLT